MSSSSTLLSADDKNRTMSTERAIISKLFEASYNGDYDTLQQTILQYIYDHNNNNNNNNKSTTKKITVSDVLLQFKDAKKRTILHFACQSAQQKQSQLQQKSTCIDKGSNDSKIDPNDIVTKLLFGNTIINSNEKKTNNYTMLHIPEGTIQKMIRLKDEEGLTPLMIATQLSNTDISTTNNISESRVFALLQKATMSSMSTSTSSLGKLTLARSKTGATALHYASSVGASEIIIQTLIKDGPIALTTFSLRGGTPLHWSCSVPSITYHPNTIETLIVEYDKIQKHKQSQQANDTTTKTTLVPIDYSNHFINMYDTTIPPALLLCIAARHTEHAIRIVQVANRLSMSNSINTTNSNNVISNLIIVPSFRFKLTAAKGVTIFHMICCQNMVQLLKIIIDTILSYNDHSNTDSSTFALLNEIASERDDDHSTPIDVAAAERHVDCVKLLLPYISSSSNNNNDNNDTDIDVLAQQYIDNYHSKKDSSTQQEGTSNNNNNNDTNGVLHGTGITSIEEAMVKNHATTVTPTLIENDAQNYAARVMTTTAAASVEKGTMTVSLDDGSSTNIKEQQQQQEEQQSANEYKQLGNEQFAQHNYNDAIHYYTKAIRINPTDATFYSNRSACYLLLHTEQQKQLKVVTTTTPVTTTTATTEEVSANDTVMTMLWDTLSYVDKALYDAVVARIINPTWSKPCYRMSLARYEQGRYEDAAVSAWEGIQLLNDASTDTSTTKSSSSSSTAGMDELKRLLQKCVQKGRKEHQQQQKKQQQTSN